MLENILPNRISNALRNIPYKNLCELRLRSECATVVNILGENYYLNDNKLTKFYDDAICVSNGVLQSIIQKLCNNSLYSVNDQLINGYISCFGGVRVGVCGEIVSVDNKIKTIKNISSINFRFPHFIKNCSLNIFNYITNGNSVYNTLIISPPGAGKTTILRDIIYQLNTRGNLLNILVVDERQELSRVYNGNEVESIPNIDVILGSTKKYGFECGIRSMKPDVIITDEINMSSDIDDIELALTCGVRVIASAHADNIVDLKNKVSFRSLLNKCLFERIVVLSCENGVGTIEGIYDENFKLIGV